jgi:predicted dehydrogenase
MHEEWSIKALEAGKHVWCEKPAALSYKSALVMAGYARKNGKRLMEGFMYRHHPQHAKVRELIQSGAIGTLEKIRARIAYPKPSSENIRMHAHLGGGFYYDALVYPLNAARMLAEAEPVSIECTMRLDPETGVDVEDEAGLFFENGLVAEISGGFSDDYRSTYEVIGTRGSLRMERAYAVPKDMPVRIFLENASGAQDFTIPAFDHFVPLARTFCESILSGSTSPDFEDELVRQARVTDAGWRSAQEHRAVTLTEVN